MPNLDVKVTSYDNNLKGNVEINNKLYPLDNVILGEIINVDLSKDDKITKYYVKEKAISRINIDCPIYKNCGSCILRHINYNEQLNIKKNYVENLFKNNFNKNYQIDNVCGMDNPFNYRNKCQVTFKNQNGKLIYGYYEENSHKVASFNNCYIQDARCNEIIEIINDLFNKMHYKAYDEDRKYGLIRHVLLKRGYKTGEVMVVIVTSTKEFPGSSNFVKAIISRCKDVTTIIQNINPRFTSIILGNEEKILYGNGYINDILLGYKFKISSKSFYQVNPIQCEKLYKIALDKANLKKTDVLLDAYSGVGTIGIIASNKVNKVISVELNSDAVKDAISNAKINHINNIHFFNADATEFIKNLAKRGDKIDVVVLDPPRSGTDIKFINATLKLNPRTIIYISCNPETLVRDLNYFINDYKINSISPVDMFPYTSSVETVVVLNKK